MLFFRCSFVCCCCLFSFVWGRVCACAARARSVISGRSEQNTTIDSREGKTPRSPHPRTGLAERAGDLGRRERAAAVGVKLRKAALHVEEECVQALKLGERELARAARVKRAAFFVLFGLFWCWGGEEG